MRVDARIQLIWRVRGQLGPAGHLLLANSLRNPAADEQLRGALIEVCDRRDVGARHATADERGLLAHGRGQLVDEPPADVVTWQQVWDLVSPGITPQRVTELNAAWRDGAEDRALYGAHLDMRLHLAECALYQPPPAPPAPRQLDLLDLIGAFA